MPTLVDWDLGTDFWESYRNSRPFPPEWFMSRIFSFHEQGKVTTFEVAHDAGAGAGVHSTLLAQRFKRIVLSDPGETSLEGAKQLLSKHDGQFEYHLSKFEEVGMPDGSVDMVFAANMLHWTHQPTAHEVAAKQLRPGGTYAIGMWWLPYIPKHPRIQQLFESIIASERRKRRPTSHAELWDAAMLCSATDTDSVTLPTQYFDTEETIRLKVNEPEIVSEYLMTMEELKECNYAPGFAKGEKVERVQDDKWTFRANLDMFTKLLDSYTFDLETQENKLLVQEMDTEINRAGGWVEGLWKATVILARKRLN